MKKSYLLLPLIWVLFGSINPAFSCSCDILYSWGFTNVNWHQTEMSETIPANSRGLLWWGEFDEKGPPPVSIQDEFGASKEIEYERFFYENSYKALWLFRPKGGFSTGKRYIFRTQRLSHSQRKPITVSVNVSDVVVESSSNKIPIKQRMLSTDELINQNPSMCSEHLSSKQLHIEMDLPDYLKPFKNYFFYETIIDGHQKWTGSPHACSIGIPGANEVGKGEDILFGTCELPNTDKTYGLTPGKHTVRMRASLPGAFTWILSAPIEVNLPCDLIFGSEGERYRYINGKYFPVEE